MSHHARAFSQPSRGLVYRWQVRLEGICKGSAEGQAQPKLQLTSAKCSAAHRQISMAASLTNAVAHASKYTISCVACQRRMRAETSVTILPVWTYDPHHSLHPPFFTRMPPPRLSDISTPSQTHYLSYGRAEHRLMMMIRLIHACCAQLLRAHHGVTTESMPASRTVCSDSGLDAAPVLLGLPLASLLLAKGVLARLSALDRLSKHRGVACIHMPSARPVTSVYCSLLRTPSGPPICKQN